ncbi:13539_t:CDS:2 [Rhizophagus irregularis]|nr:13539_t:CDS:2 [Rhizophagus irregularis]
MNIRVVVAIGKKLIKKTVTTRWHGIRFFEHVLLVISVESNKIDLQLKPEAAAIYCMQNPNEHNNGIIPINDCGGGTVDLTARKITSLVRLLNELEIFVVDMLTKNFLNSLIFSRILDESTINLLRENNYGQMQYMIQQFCQRYCKDDIKEKMIVLLTNFENLKFMFDLVVGKIIRLIRGQLNSSKDKCSAIFLVGGFGEPKYLQMKEFGKLVPAIIVPKQPIAAIVRGACDYGLKMSTIADRTLKYTYGTKVGVDQKFSRIYHPPEPNVTFLTIHIFKTTELSAKFCDEPGMKLLGVLIVDLPDVNLGFKS